MDAGQVRARKLRRIRNATGRKQRRVIGERTAVREAHGQVFCIDLGDLGVAALDAVAKVEFGLLEGGFLAARLARQLVFAEHGAVVGQLRLVTDHDQPTGETFLAERLRGGLAGAAGAEDDKAALIRRRRVGLGVTQRFERNQDASGVDIRLVTRQRIDRGRRDAGAGAEVEARLVPGAENAVAAANALGQRSSGMGAEPIEGQDLPAHPHEQ